MTDFAFRAWLPVSASDGTWTDVDPNDIVGLVAGWMTGDYTVSVDGQGVPSAATQRVLLRSIGARAASASQPWYYHGDQVGTTRLVTDNTMIAEKRFYSAFGERVDGGGSGGTAPAGLGPTRFGYVGGLHHEELAGLGGPGDLVHMGARWYAPALGRFLQRDPIGLYGGGMFTCMSRESLRCWLTRRARRTWDTMV